MSASPNANGPSSRLAPVSQAVSNLFQGVRSFFSPKSAIDGRINALNADLAKAVVDSNIPLDPVRLAEFRSAQAEVARLQKEVDAIVDAKVSPANVVLTRNEFAELASIMRSLEGRINELNDLVGVHKSERELARQEIARLETLNRVWEAKSQQQRQQEQQAYVPLPPAPTFAYKPKPASTYLAVNQPPQSTSDDEEEEEEEDEEEEQEQLEDEETYEQGDESDELAETPSFKKVATKNIKRPTAVTEPTTPTNKRKSSSSSRRATSVAVNKRKSPTPRVTNRPKADRKMKKTNSKSTSSKGRSKSAVSSTKKRNHQRRRTASARATKYKNARSSTKKRAR